MDNTSSRHSFPFRSFIFVLLCFISVFLSIDFEYSSNTYIPSVNEGETYPNTNE